MGEAAGQGSDFVVLTSDNPRTEDPEAILADVLPGLRLRETRRTLCCPPHRREAIRLALAEARAGDIVLIAGKGHEKTQTTREGVLPRLTISRWPNKSCTPSAFPRSRETDEAAAFTHAGVRAGDGRAIPASCRWRPHRMGVYAGNCRRV